MFVLKRKKILLESLAGRHMRSQSGTANTVLHIEMCPSCITQSKQCPLFRLPTTPKQVHYTMPDTDSRYKNGRPPARGVNGVIRIPIAEIGKNINVYAKKSGRSNKEIWITDFCAVFVRNPHVWM